jgi:SET domain-containing protein
MRTHSYLSKKCIVQKSQLGGYGVFTLKKITMGDLIAVWGGVVYSGAEVDKLAIKFPIFNKSPVSVFEGFYLGPLKKDKLDDAERFNHSCDPNAGVKGQIILVARRNIKAGEEICFDYDTTEIESVPFNCKCGSNKCRKTIDGSGWKDADFCKKNKPYLSWYILEKLRKKSK